MADGKKSLDNFYRDFTDWRGGINLGDFYRNYTLEFDPIHKNRAGEYRQIDALQMSPTGTCDVSGTLSIINFRYKLFQGLREIVNYFAGEYTDTNPCIGVYKDFHNCWRRFFEEFYFRDVYVGYGDELLNLELKSWEGREDIIPERCEHKSKIRLFKLVKNNKHGLRTFSSIYTGIEYAIDEKRTPLVRASFQDGWPWLDWVELISERLGIEQNFLTSVKLAIKKLMLEESNVVNSNSEYNSLMNNEPIFKVNSTNLANVNEYKPIDLMTPEAPKLFLDGMLNWWEFRTNQYGYLQNMADKKERLTSGENAKDLHAISNIQGMMLKQLNRFAQDFNDAYPFIRFNFNVSNWGELEVDPSIGSYSAGREGDTHESMHHSWQKRHEMINRQSFK